jgi:hypothetical protein
MARALMAKAAVKLEASLPLYRNLRLLDPSEKVHGLA